MLYAAKGKYTGIAPAIFAGKGGAIYGEKGTELRAMTSQGEYFTTKTKCKWYGCTDTDIS